MKIPGLISFVKKCREQGIDFYAASYAKLMLLYQQKEPVTEEKVSRDFCLETIY